jgi:hypothetical protein
MINNNSNISSKNFKLVNKSNKILRNNLKSTERLDKDDIPIEKKLDQKNLRKVNIKDWKILPNELDNKKKCVELQGFPYVFIDCDENIHDLRNKDNCPSFNNIMKKEKRDIKNISEKKFIYLHER